MKLIGIEKAKAFPREVWIGWVSSMVEAYNMAIYSFLSPLLFYQANTSGAVFFSYSLVFLGSCFLYPAGAIYYGLIGDRYGRQRICVYSTLGLAIATGLISYVLKYHRRETPAFCTLNQERLKEVKWSTFRDLKWQRIVKVIFVLAFFIVVYSFIFIFLPLVNIGTSIENFSTFKSLIAYGLLLVASGWIADKIGIQETVLIGVCLFSAVIIPSTFLCNNILTLQMILTPCACLVIGPIHSWMPHQFSISQRCRGIFISSAIATSVFGGSAVQICLMIYEKSHSLVVRSLYPLIIALGTFGCLICIRQSKKVLA